MANRKMQKIAALALSAAIALTSAPGVAYASPAGSGTTEDGRTTETGTQETGDSGSSGSETSESGAAGTVDSSSTDPSDAEEEQEISGITIHTFSDLTYNGKAQKLLDGIDGTETGDIIEYKINDGEYSTDEPEATDAGDYTVGIRIQRSGYKDFTKDVDVSIATADMRISNTPYTLNYNTTNQALMAEPSVKEGPSDVVFHYSVNDGAVSTALPKASDAGSYHIRITADGGKNFNDYEADLDAKINAVSISGLTAALYGGVYDGKHHDAVTSIKLKDGTDILSDDSGYVVRYTMDGKDYGTTMPTVCDAGTHKVEISVEKDPNYVKTDIASEDLTPAEVVVSKAKPELSWNDAVVDGDRVTIDGKSKVLDLHAIRSNATVSDSYSEITYTVANDSDGDKEEISDLASIDKDGKLTLKKAGCNLLIAASCKGDANHEDAEPITYGITVAEDDADTLLHFKNSEETFKIGSSDTVSDQAAEKASDDNGAVAYSLEAGAVSAKEAGISLNADTGKVTVADEDKLIKAAEAHDGSVSFTVNAKKKAGIKTAGWDGWKDKERTVYDKAEASYKVTLRLDTALSASDLTLQDASGNKLTGANGKNGWFNTGVVVKPASGYEIARDDLAFADQVSFGADGKDQGSGLTYGVYLKNTTTGEVSRKILLSNLTKIDSVAPTVDNISLSAPKQKKSILWFFNRSDDKAMVTVTGSDETSGIDHFEWVYTRDAGASSSNESTLSGTVSAKIQSDGTYQGSFTLPDDAKEDLKNGQLRGALSVTAVDKAGLKQGKTDDGRTIVVDSISPTMETKMAAESDNTPITKENDVYYTAGDVELTLDVTEANFDSDDVKITVTRDQKLYSVGNTWSDAESGDTHECSLSLSGEGDYHVAVSYQDASGNQMKDASYDIHIDKTAPVVNVSYLNEDVKDKTEENGKTRSYFDSTQTARITITDHSFDPSKVSYAITADGKTADSSLYTVGEWRTDGDTHTTDITFNGEANYSFNLTCEDQAGNRAANREDDLFTVDKTAPEGRLDIAGSSSGFTSLIKKLIYKIFNIQSIEVKGSADDRISGIRSVDYYIYAPDQKGEFDGLSEKDLEELDASEWKTFGGSVSVDPDSAAFVYLRIIDHSGNVTYINTAEGAIADRTAPKVSISLDLTNGIVSGADVPFTVKTDDPVSGKTYSGIRSISWKVLCDGKETQSGSTTDGLEIGSRVETKSVSDSVSAKKNNSNQITISAEATDWAGNTTTVTKSLSVDLTSPEITLSYDNNDVHNGHYFNSARNLTVKVKERNFDENTLVLPVTVDGVSYNLTIANLRDGKYADQDIALVSGSDDSEKGKTNTERTDERTNTYVICFGGSERSDHDYTVSASETDTAGNTSTVSFADGTKAGDSFTVDMVKPVISVSYSRDLVPSTDAAAPTYSRQDVQPEILVTERNFSAKGASMEAGQKDFSGNSLSVYNDGARVSEAENWKSNGKENRYQPSVFTKDANYSLSFAYTDLAGNAADPYTEHYFTVDKTAPEGTLKYETEETIFNKLVDKIRYWIYGTKTIGVVGSAMDQTSGIEKLEYLIYHPEDAKAKGTFDGGTTESILDQMSGWQPFTGRVTIDPDNSGFVYLRMTDKAGNRSYVNTSDGAAADKTAPDDIAIQLDESPVRGDVYNTDVPFTVTVADPIKNDSYSGLKKIRWSVLKDGKETQSGTFNDGLTQSAKVQTRTCQASINAEKNNSNDVILRIETEDWAGNTASKDRELSIDVTKPTVRLSYDNNSAQNEKYFKDDRTLTVLINERNFHEEDFSFPMMIDGEKKNVSFADIRDGKYSLTMVQDKRDTEADVTGRSLTDSRTITYQIGFGKEADADHDYRVGLTGQDTCGNAADVSFADGSVAPSEFTIDKVAPVIRVSAKSDGKDLPMTTDPANPAFTQYSVTVTEVVNERNFDAKDASYAVTQKDARGQAVSVYTKADITDSTLWSANGTENVFHANVFSGDANYSAAFTYTDLAGNVAIPYEAHYFTVDKTAPTGTLRIDGDETIFDKLMDKLRYWIYGTKTIGIVGSADDETSGIEKLEYLIYHPENAKAKGTFDSEMVESVLDKSSGWQPFTGRTTIDPDNSGFVYLRMTDKAGNRSYVNTSDGAAADQTAPSDISIKLDESPARGDIYNKDVPFTVTVSDPVRNDAYSGLKNIRWSVLSDEKVTQSGTFDDGLERSARVQTHTGTAVIDASKNNSNNVILRVETEDWAGNTASREQKLSIDISRPKVVLSYDNNSARNGKYFKDDRTMTIRITERNYQEEDFSFPMMIDGEERVVSLADIREGRYSLSMVQDKQDTEAGVSDRSIDDSRTITYQIGFGKAQDADHDYQVVFTGQDTCGNVADVSFADGSVAPSEFTIDKVAPVIRVSAKSAGKDLPMTTDPTNPAFTQQSVTVTEIVDERNFDAKDASYVITQKNAKGKDVAAYSAADITDQNLWSANGTENIFHANVFSGDANYSAAFAYTDLAGNAAISYEAHYFTVDKTAPTGTLRIDGEETIFDKLMGKLRYWVYGTKTIGIVGSADDETSGVADVEYLVYHPADADAKGSFDSQMTESVLDQSKDWKPFTGRVAIDPDNSGFVYLRMTDRAGNRSYINTSDGAVADQTAPDEISIRLDEEPVRGTIYNKDVPFTVTVTDPVKNDTYAGLKDIRWSVLSDGKVTQSGTFDDGLERSARVQTHTGTAVIDASKNNSNNVVLRVETEDWAGNTASREMKLSIDVSRPKVVLSYNNNSARNGKYFKDDRTMTIRITERNYQEEDFSFPMTIDGEEKIVSFADIREGRYSLSMVQDKQDTEAGVSEHSFDDNRTITYQIGFGMAADADHDYKVAMTGQDTSGNAADVSFADGSVAPSEFTIDKVAPVIRVSAESDGKDLPMTTDPADPAFTQYSVTVTEVVNERNFDAKDASYAVTQKNARGQAVSVYTEADITNSALWSTSGIANTFRANVFSEDANYSAAFAYTDLAGNAAVPYKAHYFTVDKTAPTGTLQVDGDETIFDHLVQKIRYWVFGNKSIDVSGTSDDETSGVDKVEYLLYHPTPDENAKGTFDSRMTQSVLDQETGWKPFNGKVSVDPDSSEFVYLKIIDRAGNRTYINTADGVVADQTKPDNITITLDNKPTRGTVYSGDVPFTVTVSDVKNGDTYAGLKNVRWTVLKDGEETQTGIFNDGLERGERVQKQTGHATVEAKKNNSNNVVIRVDVEDWAGNKATKEHDLAVDITNPKVTLSYDNNNAQNGKYFKDDRDMTVTIRERNFNEEDFSFPMTVDGVQRTVSLADIRNGNYGLTMVRDMTDSESGAGEKSHTDNRTITYIVGFGKSADADHDYRVDMIGQDTAGNQADVSFVSSSVAPNEFTVDKVAPVIRVVAESAGSRLFLTTDPQNPAFTQNPTEITEEIEERNFDAKDASYQITQKNAAGNEISVYSASDIRNGSLWSSNGSTNTFHPNIFTSDANYSIAFMYTDLAGNTAVPYETHYFTVDKTAPTGSLTTGAKGSTETFTSLIDRLRFLFHDRNAITVTGSSSDDTAGLASVRYLVYDPGVNAKNTFAGLTASQLEAMSGWADWNGSVSISPDKEAIVYLRMEDRAGNVAYINTADGIVADDTNPSSIQIELLGTPSRQGIYSGNVPFRITATDPEKGGTYSGLRHVNWEIRTNGKVTQSGNFDSMAGDISARTQTITGNGAISAAQNNSNHVVIHVTTEDWAGNTAEAEKELAIDITKPVIEITYDRNDPKNGKYYNAVRTATVRVIERNFDPSQVTLNLTSTGGKPQISGWTISPQKGSNDGAVNTATIAFPGDADYTVTASCTDMAGNRSDYSRVDSFTVDRTAPEIAVSYDNNDVQNGHYYKKGRTATITVKEHNFNASSFTAAVKASYAGSKKTAPSVSSFTNSGDNHTASIRFAEDGDYTFNLQDTDLAGNVSKVYTQSEFTVDTTKPELSFFDIADESANRGTVAPGAEYSDINYNKNGVIFTLTGTRHKEKEVSGTYTATAKGGRTKMADFKHKISVDDIYTLTGSVTDLAGNVTKKTIRFSVNRFGSNYTFDKATEKFLNAYYAKKGRNLTITETNTDTLTSKGVRISKDGVVRTLKEGSDYTVEETGGSGSWKQYTYIIKASCFKGEGIYEIILDSEDAAGNRQDNKLKEHPIRFVIDATAPDVVVTGIENNGRYREIERTAEIVVNDASPVDRVTLKRNGDTVKTFKRKEIEKADGKLSYTIKAADGWQNFTVSATDAAGNTSDAKKYRVLVTTSWWQQTVYAPWFIPVVVMIAAAIGFLIFLLLWKKRKKEDGKTPTKDL